MHTSTRFRLGSFTIAAFLTQLAFAAPLPAPVPIEEVMQAPYPSSLVASAKGNAVAWVFDTKGCRNIWVAQGAHARQITPYTLDDGFDIGDLAWSADESQVAYVRGGSIEDDQPANVNLQSSLTVEKLAEAAKLSPRQFSRAFQHETGQSPGRAVEDLRVEVAKIMVEEGRHPIEVVAREVGFGSRDRMRRAFVRRFGQAPQEIRRDARND
jgi:AraC-like DNA-binding protein